MLEEEGLGENDQPASAVLHAAISTCVLSQWNTEPMKDSSKHFKALRTVSETVIFCVILCSLQQVQYQDQQQQDHWAGTHRTWRLDHLFPICVRHFCMRKNLVMT